MIGHTTRLASVHGPGCCGCHGSAGHLRPLGGDLNRRDFLGGSVLGGVALSNLSWSSWAGEQGDPAIPSPPPRRALVVKPVLVYSLPTRRPQTSWRNWGGIQTEEDVRAEETRISGELASIRDQADFPVEILRLGQTADVKALAGDPEVARADVVLAYAASGSIDGLKDLGKDAIVFVRHRSGPVSLWYEIVSPRFLRQHTDEPQVAGIDAEDVVVDSTDEILWRLRALCGLRNTVGTRIVAIGGADGWAQPPGTTAELVRRLWKLDICEVTYEELGSLIRAARDDQTAVARSRSRAEAYLATAGTVLETQRPFVENAFLLDEIFRHIMGEAGCRAITVNHCMGTIMPLAETSACLTLSTLNDDGYLAFCESDFVVIPSGILLEGISGKPVFLNDPTFPHDGLITLAHCTAPRKLDGATLEPARLLTHFESDYGAAPKVEMKVGQTVTNIIPDFAGRRWVGFVGSIVENPFLPICRSQIEVSVPGDSLTLAERMPGFHWMTGYGDYHRELGYALKKVPIAWECLS